MTLLKKGSVHRRVAEHAEKSVNYNGSTQIRGINDGECDSREAQNTRVGRLS